MADFITSITLQMVVKSGFHAIDQANKRIGKKLRYRYKVPTRKSRDFFLYC